MTLLRSAFQLGLAALLGLGTSLFAAPFTGVVLHTNDVHGQLYPLVYTDPKTGPFEVGGAARRATLILKQRDQAQKAGQPTLLLDGGDINTGTFESDQAKGLIDLDVMNYLRYDAAVFGNHEYDLLPPDQARFVARANFPLIAANIRDRFLRRIYRPYVLKQMGRKTVALIGLTTQDTPSTSTYGMTYPVRFTDPEMELTRILAEIQGKADFVIVLSHLGREVDLALGERFQDQIDALVGGHTHFKEIHSLNPSTLYVRAGSKGRGLGRFELRSEHKNAAGELQPKGAYAPEFLVVDERLDLDPGIQRILPPIEEGPTLATVQGELSKGPLSPPVSSSPLGNFYTEAIATMVDADMAVANKGGLRLPLPEGKVTARQVYGVCPFPNKTFIYDLRPDQLRAVFEDSLRVQGPGILEVFGLKVRYLGGKLTLTREGEPLDPHRTYSLAVSDFLARGGDGFRVFQGFPKPRVDPRPPSQLMQEFLAQRGTYTAPRDVRMKVELDPEYSRSSTP